jgi:hypothetical protein
VKLLKQLELFLFPEEHGEADDGSVDEETASDAHDHGLDADLFGVSQHNGKSCEGVLVRVFPTVYSLMICMILLSAHMSLLVW